MCELASIKPDHRVFDRLVRFIYDSQDLAGGTRLLEQVPLSFSNQSAAALSGAMNSITHAPATAFNSGS
jgi:hypothetical protein